MLCFPYSYCVQNKFRSHCGQFVLLLAAILLQYLRGALGLVPEGKKMTFHIGHRMVNVYGELGNVIKTNTSRLREATSLFSKAVSLETTSSMKAHW